MNKFLHRRLIGYFLNGLLLVIPISVTVYIVFKLFTYLDNLIDIDWFPGSGIIFLLLFITLAGFLGSTLIANPIKKIINDFFDRIPLIKTLYTSITDLLSAFVGQKKRFNKPVLVRLNESSNLEKLGFVTDEDLHDLGIDDLNKVAVYMPHSYNFSGNLFIVKKDAITPITKNASEVMKYIVSGGVTEVKEGNE
jgi:uncharacterized membrane protein|tara:strand:+ start:68 stop:649 length:582 start_codon:yes stop_codon:yes gene_type:complete